VTCGPGEARNPHVILSAAKDPVLFESGAYGVAAGVPARAGAAAPDRAERSIATAA